MGTTHSTNPRARRLERVVLRALDTRNAATMRTVGAIAHDHKLGAVMLRTEAAERFVGGRRHG